MSWDIIALIIVGLVFLGSILYSNIRSLRENIATAKSTGFHYIITPTHLLGTPWLLAHSALIPFLRHLPEAWTAKWLDLLDMERAWHLGYEPFRNVGTDTFIAVSPGGNVLFTCDSDVSTHFLRGSVYGKPTKILRMLDIFGPTLTASENSDAKVSRKITSPFFNSQTYSQVWIRSVKCSERLCEMHSRGVLEDVRSTIARATLHVLNAVCFEKDDENLDRELQNEESVADGHELSYANAMLTLLEKFRIIFLTPPLILRLSPLKVHREARQAYSNFLRYMEELKARKKVDIQQKSFTAEPSLLDMIIEAGEPSTSLPALLAPASVLGHIFTFMFAGHEANANTLTFILVMMAIRPILQESLQDSLSKILATRLPNEWNYENDYHNLMSTYTGAVINEALRLFTVLPFIPKTVPSVPQSITLAGVPHSVPADTLVIINTSATHRNPRYWPEPTDLEPVDNEPHPVTAFNPDIWLEGSAKPGSEDKEKPSSSFLRPKAGSFVPFSDGSRGCLGQRFALVELCAQVARIFNEYSVELAVDTVQEGMREEDVKMEWEKARLKAAYELSSGVKFHMSMRLTGRVPLKLVRKGKETFKFPRASEIVS